MNLNSAIPYQMMISPNAYADTTTDKNEDEQQQQDSKNDKSKNNKNKIKDHKTEIISDLKVI